MPTLSNFQKAVSHLRTCGWYVFVCVCNDAGEGMGVSWTKSVRK